MTLEVMFGIYLEMHILGPKVGRRCQHLGDILLVEGQYV